jgi:hypothetical protein
MYMFVGVENAIVFAATSTTAMRCSSTCISMSPDGGVIASRAPPLREAFSIINTAIDFPSGDHLGIASATLPVVSARTFAPSRDAT